MLQWLSRRQVGLRQIWLHNSILDADITQLHPAVTASLVDVSFSSCTRLSTETMIAFLSGCGKLQKLSLTSTSVHGGKVAAEVALHCPMLCEVTMVDGNARDADIILLASRCPKLRTLIVTKCDRLTNAAVEALARGVPGLLELSINCQDRITDGAVITLMQHCTSMVSLTLDYCNLITDTAVLAIAGTGAYVEHLNLYGCTEVTDVGVSAIAHGCPVLKSLCLAGRKQLSDASIIQVAKMCTKLNSLNLCYCHGLTDASLYAVAEHCPGLLSLNLIETRVVTPQGLRAVRSRCIRLFDLRVDNHLYDRGLGWPGIMPPPTMARPIPPPSESAMSYASAPTVAPARLLPAVPLGNVPPSMLPPTTSAIPAWAYYPPLAPGTQRYHIAPPPLLVPHTQLSPPALPPTQSTPMDVEDAVNDQLTTPPLTKASRTGPPV
jgi:hypothetical protein